MCHVPVGALKFLLRTTSTLSSVQQTLVKMDNSEAALVTLTGVFW
jgi:hypothetical protein